MMQFFKNKIFADPWLDPEEIEFSDINIDKLPDIHSINFQQELKGGHIKDHVGVMIQYYITILFQKSILVKEVIFYYLKN